MRQAGAGLMNGAQVADLLQLASTQLGDVMLVGQLRQQVEVPDQCRAQLVPGVQGEVQGVSREFLTKTRLAAERSATRPGDPASTIDPGESEHFVERLREKSFRIGLAAGQGRQAMQPFLEGQADGQEVAREEHVDAGEPRPRIPRPADEQQQRGHQHQRIEQCFQVAGLA